MSSYELSLSSDNLCSDRADMHFAFLPHTYCSMIQEFCIHNAASHLNPIPKGANHDNPLCIVWAVHGTHNLSGK